MLGEIKVGARVVHKSGGPLMLVLQVAPAPGDKVAMVRWIDAEAREHQARFPVSELRLVRAKLMTKSGLLPAFFGGQSLNRRR
jgi:hypothetical protein